MPSKYLRYVPIKSRFIELEFNLIFHIDSELLVFAVRNYFAATYGFLLSTWDSSDHKLHLLSLETATLSENFTFFVFVLSYHSVYEYIEHKIPATCML